MRACRRGIRKVRRDLCRYPEHATCQRAVWDLKIEHDPGIFLGDAF